MMYSNVQQLSGNKSVKSSNVWANTNLAKTLSALDEFKFGFPSNGLTSVSNKWWGKSEKTDVGEDGDDDDKKEESPSEKQTSLLAIRKRIAEEGREAVEICLSQGFVSKRQNKRDQDLLSEIFKS